MQIRDAMTRDVRTVSPTASLREAAQAMLRQFVQFDRQTLHVEGSTPEVLTASIKGEIPVWAQFVRENGITQE